MPQEFLYHQIAETVRQDILQGTLQPGDRLPSVRDMAAQWNCTVGTVQRAYAELTRQDLIVSRPGQGTHVAFAATGNEGLPLRRANLVHRAEAFLLEVLTAGYSPLEVEQAVRLALDRWRTLSLEAPKWPEHTLHFVGSHDPALTFITSHFTSVAPGYIPQLTFSGSLEGLIALAKGEADLTGTHLWDEESDSYNVPFIRRLLPGRRVALLTLAHRRLGLIVAPSNPKGLTGLKDLIWPGVRFVNRQPGAGTRVWLDAHLRHLGLTPAEITGYSDEAKTHSEVAQTVAEGRAEVGLGVEAAALAYELGFIPLAIERYDLVIPAESWLRPPIQALAYWLTTDEAKQKIIRLGGYDTKETGKIAWLDN